MKLSVMLILAFCFVSLSANYVQRMPSVYTQPDGSKLSLYVTGDEYEHRLHDQQGFTIVQHPQSGKAVYAIADGKGITASAYEVGKVDPTAMGLAPNLWPDPAARESILSSRSHSEGNASRAPTTGTLNNIVIFIRFLDQAEYVDELAPYDEHYNTSTQNSMHDFFLEDSNNQLTVNSSFYPASVGGIIRSFQDGHNRSYFSPYDATTNPGGYPDYDTGGTRLKAMLRQAVISVGSSVPGSLQVDADNDGLVDNITFIAQGDQDPVWMSMLWPQSWSFSPTLAASINGKMASQFNLLLSNTFDTGVACHEFSHAIGFPDLYHYSHDGFTPVGSWDLMGTHGDIPQHHLTYQKWKYGHWLAGIPTISPSGIPAAYSLTAIDQNPTACYKIASTQPNQFYVLEYRRQTGDYESNIPASGLIVYRVCTEDGLIIPLPLEGNKDGPPDEIYVYRPGGDNEAVGTIDDANFASNVGRVSLHNLSDPKPWLYTRPWIYSQIVEGNLVLTNIGTAGGTSISFTVHGNAPSVWKGTTSADWNTASNWSNGAVPNSSSWVEIPPSVYINPTGWTPTPVITGSASAGNITIMPNSGLSIGNGFLGVEGSLDNYGRLGVSSASAQLSIQGDLTFYDNSDVYVYQEAHFYIKGNLTLQSGSNVNFYAGYVEFNGTGDSYIRNYSGSTALYRLSSNKSYPYNVNIGAESTADLTVKEGIFVYAGSTLRQNYTGKTILWGSLNVSEDGYCALNNGTLSMEGSAAESLYFFGTANYLNNLSVNKISSGVVTLNSNLWVKGNINIVAGVLNASSYTIKLGGNWNNGVGTAGFVSGAGIVSLVGTGDQVVSSEHFYRLELNKTAGNWIIPTGVVIQADYYNWTAGSYIVNGGSFTVSFLDDPGIFGTISLSSGTISYHQSDTAALDLLGTLNISGGTFTLSGGNSSVYFSYTEAASLTMSGGVLDIQSQGIVIPAISTFTANITGGTIKTVKGLNVQRSDFNPTGGIVEFYGFQNVSLSVSTGSNLYNLVINKTASREAGPEFASANTVTASGTLDINGYFKLQTGTFNAPTTMNVAGNWQNLIGPAAFGEGSGTVTFDGTADQYCNNSETFYNLILNKSNRLKINNIASAVSCATYNWTAGSIEVILGSFTANDLVQNGIYGNFYVNPTGTINLYQDSSGWIDLNGFLYNSGGTINIYGGAMPMTPAFAAKAGIIMTDGLIDIKNQGLDLYGSGYTLTWDIGGGILALNGSVNDDRGNWVNSAGTIKLYGPNAYNLGLNTGSAFYNLTIDKQPIRGEAAIPTVTEVVSGERSQRIDTREEAINAQTNITIYGSLRVANGSFNPNGHNIIISNDLTVSGSIKMLSGGTIDVGDDVMYYGAANVNSGVINCGGNWTFGSDSTADLSGSTVHLLAPYGCSLINNSSLAKFGNLEIEGYDEDPVCDFSTSTGAPLRVSGTLIIHETNTLNLNQNSSYIGNANVHDTASLIVGDGGFLEIDGYLTLAGTLDVGHGSVISHGFLAFPSTGLLLINGGYFSNDAPWIERGVFHLQGGISINTGYLEVTNNNVYLYAHPTRIFMDADLYMGRSFSALEAGAYHPQGGSLNFTGETNCNLGITNGNYLASLTVQQGDHSSTVSLAYPTIITGEVQVNSGILAVGSQQLSIGGDVYIGSTLSLSPGASLKMEANSSLYVCSSGLLNLEGSALTPVTVTRSGSSGYYALHVESGGTIAADYAIFEYLDANGVYIQSGSTIDPLHAFHGCTFHKGISGGTLLRIDNSQTLTIAQANFPANTWGGAHNVSKTLNQGELSFITYTGAFAGATFEQDSCNRISWNISGIPMVESLSINRQSGSTNLILTWDYPYAYDLFKIMSCSTPGGTFTELGTSALKSYVVPSANTKAFFRVVAVDN